MWWWIVGVLVWLGGPLLLGRTLQTLEQEADNAGVVVADPAGAVAPGDAARVPLARTHGGEGGVMSVSALR